MRYLFIYLFEEEGTSDYFFFSGGVKPSVTHIGHIYPFCETSHNTVACICPGEKSCAGTQHPDNDGWD